MSEKFKFKPLRFRGCLSTPSDIDSKTHLFQVSPPFPALLSHSPLLILSSAFTPAFQPLGHMHSTSWMVPLAILSFPNTLLWFSLSEDRQGGKVKPVESLECFSMDSAVSPLEIFLPIILSGEFCIRWKEYVEKPLEGGLRPSEQKVT